MFKTIDFRRRTVSVLVALFVTGVAQAGGLPAIDANRQMLSQHYDPARAAYPQISEQGYTVRLLLTKEWPLHLGVSRNGSPEKILELPRVVEQVAQIRIYKDRLAVHSWLGPDEQGHIAIFDLPSGRLEDAFFAYRPVFSPDNRQIAFVRFYPAHFLQSYEDQEMIYDLAASPAQNRPAYGSEGPPTEKRGALHRAGWPVYPLAVKEIGRQNANLDDDNDYHHKMSDFAWSADSRRVAFIDASQAAAALVVVDTRTLLQQTHAAEFNPALLDASIATLPELRDMCRVQDNARVPTCVDFLYETTRLDVASDAVTIFLSTTDSGKTRTVRVDARRLAPVQR
jgi:WD40 repeat protein